MKSNTVEINIGDMPTDELVRIFNELDKKSVGYATLAGDILCVTREQHYKQVLKNYLPLLLAKTQKK